MKKDEYLPVKMDEAMKEWLKAKAEAKDVSMGQIARQCIATVMKREQKKQKPKPKPNVVDRQLSNATRLLQTARAELKGKSK